MGQYDHFVELKQSNERIKYLCETQDKISREITQTFSILQKATDKSEIHQLNEKMSHLTTLHHQMKDEYETLLKQELSLVYQRWPDLFTKIVEGVDRDTLDHVLKAFDEYQSGHLSADAAVISGMDYMTTKYQLPPDFFNKAAVGQFNKNIHKVD